MVGHLTVQQLTVEALIYRVQTKIGQEATVVCTKYTNKLIGRKLAI